MSIEIKTVGVIGAGQMGSGIAHVCSLAGFCVQLNDLSEDRINAGLATISGNMLDWISDPALRRRTNAGLNKGEARNALARALFFHRDGELRDRTFEVQRYRASGLNLTIAPIILWNTVYLSRAVEELRSGGGHLPDELLARIEPLGWEHISFNGDYVWPTKPLVGHFRPLRTPRSPFLEAA
jgi:hypothetical protein